MSKQNKLVCRVTNVAAYIFGVLSILAGLATMIVTGILGQYAWGSYLPLAVGIPAIITNFIALFLIYEHRIGAHVLFWITLVLWFLFFILILITSPEFIATNLITSIPMWVVLIPVIDLYFNRIIELDSKKVIYRVNYFKQITIPYEQVSSYSFGLFHTVHIGSSSCVIRLMFVECHKEITEVLIENINK